jgi:hypothetical protein
MPAKIITFSISFPFLRKVGSSIAVNIASVTTEIAMVHIRRETAFESVREHEWVSKAASLPRPQPAEETGVAQP